MTNSIQMDTPATPRETPAEKHFNKKAGFFLSATALTLSVSYAVLIGGASLDFNSFHNTALVFPACFLFLNIVLGRLFSYGMTDELKVLPFTWRLVLLIILTPILAFYLTLIILFFPFIFLGKKM